MTSFNSNTPASPANSTQDPATKPAPARSPLKPTGVAAAGTPESGAVVDRSHLVYGRIPIEQVAPVVHDGRRPATAVPGESIRVAATVYREGHDALGVAAVLRDPDGNEQERVLLSLMAKGTDRYEGWVTPTSEGDWSFTIEGFSDVFGTWHHDAAIKLAVGQDVELMMDEGALVFERAAAEDFRPEGQRRLFAKVAEHLKDRSVPAGQRFAEATDRGILSAVASNPIRALVTESRSYPIRVERDAAGRGAWYEFFPRSEGAEWNPETGHWRSGNFVTAAERLDAVAGMGFDVIYLPPIHPIGVAHRKGPNNSLTPAPGDPGSPWAIGAAEGGHDTIHPDLGGFEEFDAFVARAQELGLEVALDLALQASPDHPWVQSNPEWFTTRADGTIAYAENPPKKYQDIYPLNFDNDPEGLSQEVLRIVKLWMSHGIRIFRVDNPHTKPLWFWEWLLGEVHKIDPGVVFLAEAFTRPAMMQGLAKAGYQQSYSYFTWRNAKWELEEYLEEISRETSAQYRPNFFVNTPDILTDYFVHGGRPAFKIRAALAATASPLWGMYAGYELYENVQRPGAEEANDNEKYQYRPRDFDAAEARGDSLAPYVRRLNQIRREHPALMDLQNLTVHNTDDDAVLCFSKTKTVTDDDGEHEDTLIVVVNTDPHAVRMANINLDLAALKLRPEDLHEDGTFSADDLLTGASWNWGEHVWVRLDPFYEPVHVVQVRRSR
ncbi:alpha-1,4-glucan--maltose-1-phosphate maltosyltransferase [Kocuria sp.]|uniref:alpha-1,4-glucan--maltose-1-phosphate maltosyltransferase n=1 Tax=Kocuria sp. TaxID=1871328 RepID=UPI003F8D2860